MKLFHKHKWTPVYNTTFDWKIYMGKKCLACGEFEHKDTEKVKAQEKVDFYLSVKQNSSRDLVCRLFWHYIKYRYGGWRPFKK